MLNIVHMQTSIIDGLKGINSGTSLYWFIMTGTSYISWRSVWRVCVHCLYRRPIRKQLHDVCIYYPDQRRTAGNGRFRRIPEISWKLYSGDRIYPVSPETGEFSEGFRRKFTEKCFRNHRPGYMYVRLFYSFSVLIWEWSFIIQFNFIWFRNMADENSDKDENLYKDGMVEYDLDNYKETIEVGERFLYKCIFLVN